MPLNYLHFHSQSRLHCTHESLLWSWWMKISKWIFHDVVGKSATEIFCLIFSFITETTKHNRKKGGAAFGNERTLTQREYSIREKRSSQHKELGLKYNFYFLLLLVFFLPFFVSHFHVPILLREHSVLLLPLQLQPTQHQCPRLFSVLRNSEQRSKTNKHWLALNVRCVLCVVWETLIWAQGRNYTQCENREKKIFY